MAVAKIIEIIAGSKTSFADAVQQGIDRATATVGGVTGSWIKDQNVIVEKGKIVEYRVVMKVTFMLNAPKAAKK